MLCFNHTLYTPIAHRGSGENTEVKQLISTSFFCSHLIELKQNTFSKMLPLELTDMKVSFFVFETNQKHKQLTCMGFPVQGPAFGFRNTQFLTIFGCRDVSIQCLCNITFRLPEHLHPLRVYGKSSPLCLQVPYRRIIWLHVAG